MLNLSNKGLLSYDLAIPLFKQRNKTKEKFLFPVAYSIIIFSGLPRIHK